MYSKTNTIWRLYLWLNTTIKSLNTIYICRKVAIYGNLVVLLLNKIEIVYVDLDYLNSHNTILLVIPNRYEESSVFDDMELLNEEIYYSAEAPL